MTEAIRVACEKPVLPEVHCPKCRRYLGAFVGKTQCPSDKRWITVPWPAASEDGLTALKGCADTALRAARRRAGGGAMVDPLSRYMTARIKGVA